jgi:hypothetical protein
MTVNFVRPSSISKQVYTHKSPFEWVWNSFWVLGFTLCDSHLSIFHVQTPVPQTSGLLHLSIPVNYQTKTTQPAPSEASSRQPCSLLGSSQHQLWGTFFSLQCLDWLCDWASYLISDQGGRSVKLRKHLHSIRRLTMRRYVSSLLHTSLLLGALT